VARNDPLARLHPDAEMRPRPAPRFATEADLCAAFAEKAALHGWAVWPEVQSWDLILVSTTGPSPHSTEPHRVPGYQVAVEAKLRPGLGALASAVGRCQYYNGREHVPHAAAVLVPARSHDLATVAAACGLHVYTPDDLRVPAPAPRWDGAGLPLPPVPLQSPGGEPCPRVLSRWRLGALRLCDALQARGVLVGEDFRREAVEPQRWLDARWIVRDGDGLPARYVAAERLGIDGPSVGYEAERVALRAHERRRRDGA